MISIIKLLLYLKNTTLKQHYKYDKVRIYTFNYFLYRKVEEMSKNSFKLLKWRFINT